MSFEDFRASQKEEQNKGKEDQEISSEYTLKSILANKERGNLFAEEVAKDDPDLAERLAKKELTEDDLEEIKNHREEFVEKLKQVEKVKENIPQEVLEDIINNSPELKKIAEFVDINGVKNILFKKFESLVFNDPDHFNQINKAVEKMTKHKEVIAKNEEDIKELSKKYNVSEDKLYEALKIKDDKERRKAIKAVVKDRMGFYKKIAFGIAHAATMERVEALDKRDKLKELSDDLNKRLKGVGKFLTITINENNDVRQALQAEFMGEKETTKENVASFKEGRDTWRDFEEKTQEDIENDFKNFILKEERIKVNNYNMYDNTQKESLINKFFEKKKQKLAGKKGFWANLFGGLFETKKRNLNINRLRKIA